MLTEIKGYQDLVGLNPSTLEPGIKFNLSGESGKVLGYKQLQNVIQDPATGLYKVTFGPDVDTTGQGYVQGQAQTLLMTPEGQFIDWSGRPSNTPSVAGDINSGIQNYSNWLSSNKPGYSPEVLAQKKQDVTLRGTELGPPAGSATTSAPTTTVTPTVNASLGTTTPTTTTGTVDVAGFPKSSDEYDQWIAMGRKFNPTTGKWTENAQSTQQGTQDKVEVAGFPKSSDEYDQWIAQGRTFDASTGKWYESGGTTGTGSSGGGASVTGGTGTSGEGTTTTPTTTTPSDFTTLYTQALKDTGVSDIKTKFEAVVKEQNDLTNEMNDKIADINENPWMSQSVRNREISRIQSRYESRLTTLTNEQKLFDSLYQQGVAEAKYLATGEAEQQQFLLQYIQDAEDAKAKLQQQAIDNKDKSLKTVNGGLYDTSTNSWVVAPSSSGTSGLTNSQMNTTINSIANSFDNEQIVKDYNQATSQYQLMSSIGSKTSSPGDDIAFVYAFAKIMDPNSVVREGEYNTVQKYAQSFLDAKTLEAIRLVKNTNFLSADAKQQLLNAAGAKMKVIETQYDNIYNQYQNRINNVQSGGYNTITDYSQAFGGSNSSNLEDIQALKDAGYTDDQITEILSQ